MSDRVPVPRPRQFVLLVFGALLGFGLAKAQAAPLPETDDPKVAEYVKTLKNKSAVVRKQAAAALGDLGAKAKSAVPALREALLDADEGVQVAAATALEKISPDKATPKNVDQELKKRLAELEAIRAEAQAQAEIAKAESVRARKIAEELEVRTRDSLVKLERMAKELQDEKDRQADLKAQSVKDKAELEALKKRNEDLLQRIKELEKALDKEKRGGDEGKPARANPPENIEGLVKAVDAGSGLVSINIGSDSGLAKGHTLAVYRLDLSNPKGSRYIGQVEVLDVRPKEAVVRPVKKSDAIQVGDRVASQR